MRCPSWILGWAAVAALFGPTASLAGGANVLLVRDMPPETIQFYESASADDIAAALTNAGHSVTDQLSPDVDPTQWGSYDVIVASSGIWSPSLQNHTYRTALLDWVAGGGRLVIEGGEVGFIAWDAQFTAPQPMVLGSLLNASEWRADDAGSGVAALAHPLRTTPHTLDDVIEIDYLLTTHQDAMVPSANAQLVYANPATSGGGMVIALDDGGGPLAGQIVYLAFAYERLVSTTMRDQLVVNAVDYVLADDGDPTGNVSGQVLLQESPTHAGVTVSTLPPSVAAVTGPHGEFVLNGMYPGRYELRFEGPPGWESKRQAQVLDNGQTVQLGTTELRTVTNEAACDEAPLAIPDNDPQGVTRALTVTEVGDVASVSCEIESTHPFRGDLIVELTSPTGTIVRLHNRTGGTQADLLRTFDDDNPADGPGSLSDFVGETATGGWILRVVDDSLGDEGTLDRWCVTVGVAQDGAVPVAVSQFHASLTERGVTLAWTQNSSEPVVLARAIDDGPWRPRQTQTGPRTVQTLDRLNGVPAGAGLRYRLQTVGEIPFALSEAVELTHRTNFELGLHGNHPNPFNPSTTITFAIDRPGHARVFIVDAAGRHVQTLLDRRVVAASYTSVWDGKDHRGRSSAAGVYRVVLDHDGRQRTQPIVLVK